MVSVKARAEDTEDWSAIDGQKEPYIGGTWSYSTSQLAAGDLLAVVKDALERQAGSAEKLRALLGDGIVACEVLELDSKYQGGYKKVMRTRATVVDCCGLMWIVEL